MTDAPHQPILQSDYIRGCTSIGVNWSAPAREALGGPITEYLPQIRIANSEQPWINCTAFNNTQRTSCLFTNLNPNTNYEVQVAARNQYGYGSPSEILTASTIQAGTKTSRDKI